MKYRTVGWDVEPVTAKSKEVIIGILALWNACLFFTERGQQQSPVLPLLVLFSYRGVSLTH